MAEVSEGCGLDIWEERGQVMQPKGSLDRHKVREDVDGSAWTPRVPLHVPPSPPQRAEMEQLLLPSVS